jgi:hypothetical protein
MKKILLLAGVLGAVLLIGTIDGRAETWVKNGFDIPNKNVEANFLDSDSVKVIHKTLNWTEKFNLTAFGIENYNKHLSQYPVCKQNIAKKGQVTHHQIDLQIAKGKYRQVAKRNYNKANELMCTDKDMGKDFDKAWRSIEYGTPMYERHYYLTTKYKVGDL